MPCSPDFVVTSDSLDLVVTVALDDREWKLASWRGEGGVIKVSLTSDEFSTATVAISTVNATGPTGAVEIREATPIGEVVRSADRLVMDAVDIHYRQYLGGVDRRSEAIQLFNIALRRYSVEGSKNDVARTAFELASLHYGLNDYDQAERFFLLASETSTQLSDVEAAAAAHNMVGLSQWKLGKLDSAIASFESSKELRMSAGQAQHSASSINNVGLIQRDQGHFHSAIESFSDAIHIRGLGFLLSDNFLSDTELTTRVSEVIAPHVAVSLLNNLALANEAVGNHKAAITHWQYSKVLSEGISSRVKRALIGQNIANARIKRGQIEQALLELGDAERILAEESDRSHLALARLNSGKAYLSIGRAQDALDYFSSALELYKISGELAGIADAEYYIGTAYAQFAAERSAAIESLRRAQGAYGRLGLRSKEAAAQTRLAEQFISDRQFDMASRAVGSAIRALVSTGEVARLGSAHIVAARAAQGRGDLQRARYHADKSVSLLGDAQDLLSTPQALIVRSKISHEGGRRSEAVDDARRALEVVGRIGDQFHKTPQRAAWRDAHHLVTSHTAKLLIEAGALSQAFQIWDSAKAITFGSWGISEISKYEIQEVLDALAAKRALRAQEYRSSEQTSIKELDREIRELHRRLESRQTRDLEQEYADRYLEPKLGDDTVLLEYMLESEHAYIFVWHRSTLKVLKAGNSQAIVNDVAKLNVAILQRRSHIFREVSGSLYALLLRDALRELDGVNKLVIVPDGALHQLPFAALVNESGEPLISNYDINLTPMSHGYTAFDAPKTKPTVAVFADPVYQSTDARITGSVGLDDPVESTLLRSDTLYRLHASATEAKAIAEVSDDVRLYVGFDANVDNFFDSIRAGSSILHLATHNFADVDLAGLSALALSRFDQLGAKRSHLVRSVEVASLDLDLELAVLSACNTHVGKAFRGEGMLGIGRAFLDAGSDAIIASLWPIDDEATAQLMGAFYRSLIRDKRNVSNSLRVAQNAVRESASTSDPFFWAGFVAVRGLPDAWKPLNSRQLLREWSSPRAAELVSTRRTSPHLQ